MTSSSLLTPSLNEPCGPRYNPTRELYYISYQFHPNHYDWGDIGWGMASSKDLITWVDSDRLPKDGLQAWQNNQAETISTTNDTNPDYINSRYNALGIWSGTAQPVNLNGSVDGTLLAFYTSISALPLSWDGNYPTGAESQSFAISIDGGAKFTRYDGNPVVRGSASRLKCHRIP